MRIYDEIRKHLLDQVGLSDADVGVVNLDLLERSEWSPDFERFMRNRLIMGALRYGKMGSASKPQYDRISAIVRRVKQYRETGNDEMLVDIANLALLEFVEGEHPQKHFDFLDCESEHVESVARVEK